MDLEILEKFLQSYHEALKEGNDSKSSRLQEQIESRGFMALTFTKLKQF